MERMNRRTLRGLLVILATAAAASLLPACAPAVRSVPTQLSVVDPSNRPADLRFTAPLEIRLPTGYGRQIPASSRWLPAGRLSEGHVYRPVDLVFSIEGQQVHEAWLVVRNGVLQGFYLPAEARFSLLDPPVQLPKGTQP